MSVKATTWVWALELSPTEKLLALAYADYADPHGRDTHPSVGQLMERTRLGRRAVQISTRRLEEAGILIRVGATARGVAVWRMPIDEDPEGRTTCAGGGAPGAPQGAHDVRGRTTCAGGRTRSAPGAHDVRGGGAPRAPVPSVEPSSNLSSGSCISVARARKGGRERSEDGDVNSSAKRAGNVDPAAKSLWTRLRRELSHHLDPDELAAWFEPLDVEPAERGLVLVAADQRIHDTLEESYRPALDRAVADVAGPSYSVAIRVRSEAEKP